MRITIQTTYVHEQKTLLNHILVIILSHLSKNSMAAERTKINGGKCSTEEEP